MEYYKPIVKDQVLTTRIGVGQRDFVFGSVAGLGAHKRVDVIVKAASEMKNERQFKIVLLGHEEGARKILAFGRDLGVENRIIYAGMVEDVRPYISIFDVGFVLSDSIETISYAAREMMAMGTPLISSSYCGLRENVDEGVNGYLVRPGNVDEVKKAMVSFLEMSNDQYVSFRTAAREKAVKNFSVAQQISGLEEVYREAVLSRRRTCELSFD